MRRRFFPLFVICLLQPALPVETNQSSPAANSNATYQALRHAGLGGGVVTVNNFVLKRDAGKFTFQSGTFSFLAPVNGKITGAVFVGSGTFSVTPPIPAEQRTLSLLTKQSEMQEEFPEAVFRFTDGTYEELKKAGSPAPTASGGGALEDVNNDLRHHLHYNLSARILQDVLSEQPGGLFLAFIKGKKYNSKELFAVDPHGLSALGIDPEEVAFMTYDENKFGIWAAFHFSAEIAAGTASGAQQNAVRKIVQQKITASVDKSAHLDGIAQTTVESLVDGLRVVPFALYPTLRVSRVTDSSGRLLDFVQEDKNDDPDFSVILAQPLKKGEKIVIQTSYGGKDAISNEGGGNYYVMSGARDSWFPNSRFGDYATYDLILHAPKGLQMVATGNPVNEKSEGENTTEWKSDVPLAVAGFNLGRFKRQEAKVEKEGYLVESYANEDEPDIFRTIKNFGQDEAETGRDPFSGQTSSHVEPTEALGSMSTTSLAKKALGEGQLSLQLYSDFFGPMAYKRLAMTQQTAFNYGQAWPGLVYMPITAYLDTTTRHGLHMDDPHGYFKVVGPHEVAHQWWGHSVGFNSYRDQWMSEGFADFSASLFLQQFYGVKQYLDFWQDEQRLMTETNKEGFRAIDVGPVTQGYRLASSKSGFDIPRRLIYPKGAYILHMVRMMMWNSKTHDDAFKTMMHDFTQTYMNRVATTEDFKAMIEKHMTQQMDVDGDHKMGWFFDEYVYGTALPTYKLEYTLEEGSTGMMMNLKITQSGVTEKFAMLVPLYLELADGKIARLGAATIRGNSTVQQQVPLGQMGLKEKPKRAMLNYNYDVLCSP